MRTVNISIVPPKVYILTFRPDSAALGDDTLLVRSEYEVTTAPDGTASINLPVPAIGSLRYEYSVVNGDFSGVFYLGAGGPVNLEDLISLGVLATPTIIDYIDQKLADLGTSGGGPFADIVSGPTVTMDANQSNNFELVPTNTFMTMNFTGGSEGQELNLLIKTSGTTPRTITFGTDFLETIPFDTGIEDNRSFLIKFTVVKVGGVMKALEFGRSTMLVDTLAGGVDLTPTITTLGLLPGIVSSAYSQTIAADSGDPPITFSINSGVLPTGLTLNPSTGIISGTPTVAGTYGFTVRATDVDGDFNDKSLSIVIAADTAPTITTTTLPDGTQTVAYNQTVVASSGNPPVLFAVISGTLPAGLTLNNVTGAITGTPTTPGTSSFTVRATDVDGDFDDQALSININSFAGFTRLVHGGNAGGDSSTVTLDTTGAKLIIAAVVHIDGTTFQSFTDTKGNTWTALTERSSGGSFGGNVKIYYCINPTVGTGHGFTWSGTSVAGSLSVMAYGVGGGNAVFDVQNGAGLASSTSIQPGSVTPGVNGELLVLAFETFNTFSPPSVNSGFTIQQYTSGAGAFFDCTIADFIQSTAAAINPTATSSGGADRICAAIATFKIV